MNTYMKRIGMTVSAVLAAVSFWACTATRNPDGSMTITFAPDMVITARGLEDALGKLTDLLAACRVGTFQRPCSKAELDEIGRAIERVLARKGRLYPASLPPGTT